MSNNNNKNIVRASDSYGAGDCRIKRSNTGWMVLHLGKIVGERDTFIEAEALASDTTAILLSDECDALYADAEQSAELASALCDALREDALADEAEWGGDKQVPFVYED